MNELELIKTIESKLPFVIWPIDVKTVNGDLELQQAKTYLNQLSESKKQFISSIKVIKEPIFELHKKIVAYEKENLATGDKLKADQDSEISDYNKRVFEAQQAKNQMATLALQVESQLEAFKQTAYERINQFVNRELAAYELSKLEKYNVPISEKIDAIEEAKEIIETSKDEIVVPEIVIENVVLQKKKDAMQEVRKYFISDEKDFINWCINTRRLNFLDIKIKKSEVNKNIEQLAKDTHDFISYDVEYK